METTANHKGNNNEVWRKERTALLMCAYVAKGTTAVIFTCLPSSIEMFFNEQSKWPMTCRLRSRPLSITVNLTVWSCSSFWETCEIDSTELVNIWEYRKTIKLSKREESRANASPLIDPRIDHNRDCCADIVCSDPFSSLWGMRECPYILYKDIERCRRKKGVFWGRKRSRQESRVVIGIDRLPSFRHLPPIFHSCTYLPGHSLTRYLTGFSFLLVFQCTEKSHNRHN